MGGVCLVMIWHLEKVVRGRRQVKKIGRDFVFALPKNDRERVIPLSDWDIRVLRRHIAASPPRPYTQLLRDPLEASFRQGRDHP